MKLDIQINDQFFPYAMTVNILGITRESHIHALKALAEELDLDFSSILGDYYRSSDPEESELFRAKVSFPIETTLALSDNTRSKYWHWRHALVSAFPYLILDFIKGELTCVYLQKYGQAMGHIERYLSFGSQSIFYNPIYVAQLQKTASALRETILSLNNKSDTPCPQHTFMPR